MFRSPPSRWTAVRLRLVARLLAISAVLTLAACGDDEDDPLAPDNPIIGTWVSVEDGEYIRITRSELQLFIDFGSCYGRLDGRITDQNGDFYTVDFGGGLRGQLEIQESGGELTISNGEEASVYATSTVDVDDFEICEEFPSGEFEPELAECTSLPVLALNDEVAGSLTLEDETDPNGYRYDMYQLQLTSSQSVAIDMSSGAVDAYLYLFSSSGARLSEDDDGGAEPPDARLTTSLDAGCYIVVASSFFPAEFGDYVLGVSTF